MSYFPDVLITPKDTPAVDAFHRLRISEPVRQFSSMAEYQDNPLIWENAVFGTGTVAYQANKCSVRLSTGGTGSGAYAVRQTRRYMRYMPGKSLMVIQTFVLSTAQNNVTAEIGYNDANNGVFFQRVNSTLNWVIRTNTSGSPSDAETVAQSSWNLDKLDGSGGAGNPSGITLDVTKTQILVIDLQFLGVGRVRVGFDFGSKGIIYAHQFDHANSTFTVPYMSTACLPVRGRIINTGTAAGTVTMDMICCAVVNEGAVPGSGADSEGVFHWAATNGTATVSISATLLPLLSIRAATKLGGGGAGTTTNRGHILPTGIILYNGAVNIDAYYEMWLNASLTSPSWVAVNANSLAEYDLTANGITTTNGYRIGAGYVNSSRNSGPARIEYFQNLPIVYTGLNSVQDTLTIAVKALSGTAIVAAAFEWDERY